MEAFLFELEQCEKKLPINAQQIKPEASSRDSYIIADHAILVFKALHELFDSLKRSKDVCVLRAHKFLAQPLYILAGFYKLHKATNLYAELYPELKKLKVIPLKIQPRISLDEKALSFDPIDHLCETFEFEFTSQKEIIEPLLTNTQRNKLK